MALDYGVILNQPSAGEQIQQGIGQFLGIREAEAQAAIREAQMQQEQQQAERQAAFGQAFGAAFQSGDRNQVMALMGQFPEQYDQIKGALGFQDEQRANTLGTMGIQLGQLAQTSPQAAAQFIAQNADVLRQAGPGYEPDQLIASLKQDPAGFAKRAELLSAVALGPQKYFDITGQRAKIDAQLRGQDIQMRGQDIQQQEGAANRALDMRRLQSAEARAAQRMAIDQDKFLFDMQQAQAKAAEKIAQGPALSVNMEKELTRSIEKAGASQNSAQSLEQLANQFEANRPTPGMFGKASDMFTNLTGQEDYLKSLRTKYIGLRNSQLVANLPPGVASDKDIEMALAGFPSEFSNPDTIASFLRGMSKLEQYNAKLNNFKAEWISNNGNPAKSKAEFEVDGFRVNPGETFQQAFKRYSAPNAQANPAAGTGAQPQSGWEIVE